MCNCGHLAQVITGVSPSTLQRAAFGRSGDWGEQGRDYCPDSGLPMDEILGHMIDAGMEPEDFRHLERLTHPHVLKRLPPERRSLHHTRREDTVLFLSTWAELLEEKLSPKERAAVERLREDALPEAAE